MAMNAEQVVVAATRSLPLDYTFTAASLAKTMFGGRSAAATHNVGVILAHLNKSGRAVTLVDGKPRHYRVLTVACPNHEGGYDCTPFCALCEGDQEIRA